jgi:hypothetical protein
MIDTDRHISILVHRGKYFVRLKSGAIQRWGAAQVPVGKDYGTLSTSLWRKSFKKSRAGQPAGAEPPSPGATYYFPEESDALEAGKAFLNNLLEKGVQL